MSSTSAMEMCTYRCKQRTKHDWVTIGGQRMWVCKVCLNGRR